jgi:hypothetical protein
MSIRDFPHVQCADGIINTLTQYHCERVILIMDALRIRGHCSAREMQWLNACRMHLRVSRLSEIAFVLPSARVLEGQQTPRFTL